MPTVTNSSGEDLLVPGPWGPTLLAAGASMDVAEGDAEDYHLHPHLKLDPATAKKVAAAVRKHTKAEASTEADTDTEENA